MALIRHRRAGLVVPGVVITTLLLAACAVPVMQQAVPTAILARATLATPTEAPTATAAPSPTACATPPEPVSTPTPWPPTPVPPTATPTPPSMDGWPWGLIIRGRPDGGLVALTFDAGGRDAGETGSVLDTLHRSGVHSTFFLTGEWTEANPHLVRRMAAEGHELANHTYSHPNLTKVGDEEVLWQVRRTEEVAHTVAGVSLRRWVRPPYGAYDERVMRLLTRGGYQVVYWTLDSADWRADMSAEDIVRRVGTRANAGDVVVFHCYPVKTAKAMPGVLEALRARRLRGATLSQVLGADHEDRQRIIAERMRAATAER